MFGYRIRKFDYTFEEVRTATAEDAIRAFAAYDWDRECALYEERIENKRYPPGIVLHTEIYDLDPGATIMTICPGGGSSITFNISFLTGKRLSSGEAIRVMYSSKPLARSRVSELVHLFYLQKTAELRELCR